MISTMRGKFWKILRILLSNNSYLLKGLFSGVAAGFEHENVLRNIGKLSTIVDIGANKGQFTLISRYYCSEARVFSFEPLHEPAEKFKKLFSGDENIQFFNYAIDKEQGSKFIYISRRDDSSSLLPITSKQIEIFPGTERVNTCNIKTGRLSEFVHAKNIQKPALLKIDVQGYESNVLLGCEDLLPAFNLIYVECSFLELYEGQALAHQVIDWLGSRSFRLIGIYNIIYGQDGRTIQADLLLENTHVNKKCAEETR